MTPMSIVFFAAISLILLIPSYQSADCSKRPSLIALKSDGSSDFLDSITAAYNSWNSSVRLGFNNAFTQMRNIITTNATYKYPADKINALIVVCDSYNKNNPGAKLVLYKVDINGWCGNVTDFVNCGNATNATASSTSTTASIDLCGATTFVATTPRPTTILATTAAPPTTILASTSVAPTTVVPTTIAVTTQRPSTVAASTIAPSTASLPTSVAPPSTLLPTVQVSSVAPSTVVPSTVTVPTVSIAASSSAPSIPASASTAGISVSLPGISTVVASSAAVTVPALSTVVASSALPSVTTPSVPTVTIGSTNLPSSVSISVPSASTVQLTSASTPALSTSVVPTSAVPSSTPVPPTSALPSSTPVPPTSAVPSSTPVPPTSAVPSSTPVPPTSAVPTLPSTQVPSTPVLTSVPPTTVALTLSTLLASTATPTPANQCQPQPASTASVIFNTADNQIAKDSASIATCSCTNPLSKAFYNSISDPNPFGSAVGAITLTCNDINQFCMCTESGECFTQTGDSLQAVLVYPFCQSTDCHMYAVVSDALDGSVTMQGDISTSYISNSQCTDSSCSAFKDFPDSAYLKPVSAGCDGCASLKQATCLGPLTP